MVPLRCPALPCRALRHELQQLDAFLDQGGGTVKDIVESRDRRAEVLDALKVRALRAARRGMHACSQSVSEHRASRPKEEGGRTGLRRHLHDAVRLSCHAMSCRCMSLHVTWPLERRVV